ncbi:hypothetical protein Tco_0115869 [Tanacetum coccineum]
METHRRSKTSPASSDMFTFPEMSPYVKFKPELADQLFSNGKLLHHHFPAEQNNFTIPKSLILSRTNNISSKGSLMSSRSTSTNSRSSSRDGNRAGRSFPSPNPLTKILPKLVPITVGDLMGRPVGA